MKQRFLYLTRLFFIFILFFFLQKVIFIFANADASIVPVSIRDVIQVLYHGGPLDASTCGYLIALPFIAVWISI